MTMPPLPDRNRCVSDRTPGILPAVFIWIAIKKIILAGFLTSLLYEVTQLTGLFFIYPRPYRIFDVDDLIINTLGALVGYLIVPSISRFLPSPFEDKYELVQGSEVAFLQRLAAAAIDFSIVLCTAITGIVSVPALRNYFSHSTSLWRFPLFYILFLSVGAVYAMPLPGGTPGIRLTGLRLMTEGIMPDWIEHGLAGTPCELRLDKRYKRKMLMLSVSGEDKTNTSSEDSYVEMLEGLNLIIEKYYAAEKNICNTLIP